MVHIDPLLNHLQYTKCRYKKCSCYQMFLEKLAVIPILAHQGNPDVCGLDLLDV